MTKIQIAEFQKLEMAYLDSVVAGDGNRQLELMEVFFFWLRKQMRCEQGKVIILNGADHTQRPIEVTEVQKQEFTFLQMAMIKAFARGEAVERITIEIEMRDWVDRQLAACINNIIRPKLKLIRNNEN